MNEVVSLVIGAIGGAVIGFGLRLQETIRSERQTVYLNYITATDRLRTNNLMWRASLKDDEEGGSAREKASEAVQSAIHGWMTAESQLRLVASRRTFRAARALQRKESGADYEKLKEAYGANQIDFARFVDDVWDLIEPERSALTNAMRHDLRHRPLTSE